MTRSKPTVVALKTNELKEWLNRIEKAQQPVKKRSWYEVATVAQRLDLLQPAPRTVIVGGTNGKGSTVQYIEQLVLAQGLSVGSSYSPHLQEFNERIRINGLCVSDDEIVRAFEDIHAVRDDVHLSYHDYATLASFWIFKHRQVEVAVLEVGVGGRYDATNISNRDVNVITSIALDHQDMLGSDRETIGWEKAGISRRDVPLIYGDLNTVSTVISRAQALDCPMLRRGRDFDFHINDQELCSITIRKHSNKLRFTLSNAPKYPLSLTLAVQVLSELDVGVSECDLAGTEASNLPGRMELFHHLDRDWLLDVAHNPAAIKYLMHSIPKFSKQEIAKVLLGTLKNKDLLGIIEALSLPKELIIVTATQGRRGTAWQAQCAQFGLQCIEDLDIAYQELVTSTTSGNLILVVGSADVVGRLRAKVSN